MISFYDNRRDTDNTNTTTNATNILYNIIIYNRMIESLYIKNYLIIKEAEIEFDRGLNILTGETGAGKSIILDALALILGERADYSKIKKDEDKLIVEGQFSFEKKEEIKNIIKELFPDEDTDNGNIILRRELNRKGTSRNFINDSPVSISDMKKFGDAIIDIHSQNEHQFLLNKDTHIEILDNYTLKPEIRESYSESYNKLRELVRNYKELEEKKDELLTKRNFLDFELKEINNVNLSPGEDTDLENELKRLENTEIISESTVSAMKFLYEDDSNAGGLIKSAVKELSKIAEYDDELKKIISDLENANILVKESSDFLISYLDKLNFDADRTEQVRNRLSDIVHLKKKYGLTLDELILKAENLQKEFNFADNFDFEIEKLLKEINELRKEVFKKAKDISVLRKKGSIELAKNINKILNEVGLEGAEFKVNIENINGEKDDLLSSGSGKEFVRLTQNGFESVEFQIKINKGSDFTPLQKSASGGEISRIMLAIKTVLSEKDNIGILVFDEIDAGISGRIAQKTGKVLKALSGSHQIICITHLPQIAAMSDRHFHVSKKEDKNKNETVASIKTLNEEEKITEVAKLLSGENITEASSKSAIELINA